MMYIAGQQLADSLVKLIFTPIIFLFVALIFSSLAKVASECQRMAFTKDWIVVLVESSENSRLSAQNSIMNVLDQASSAILPLITGLILDYFSRTVCCAFVIVYNVVSWVIEGRILLAIYRDTPTLKERRATKSDIDEDEENCANTSWLGAFVSYFKQKAWRPAFALAMLYFTVLGFDNLAISYGAKQGLSATALGAFRTAGSILGLLGNISYTCFERVMGLLLTALIGFFLQNIGIQIAGYSQFLPDSPMNVTGYVDTFEFKPWLHNIWTEIHSPSTDSHVAALPFLQWPFSVLLFFFGITFARYGLWIIDPSITQIMQETIPERQRYSIFGVQTAFCEFFSVLKDIMVICFFETEVFGALCAISAVSVGLAFLLYLSYFITESFSKKTGRSNSRSSRVAEAESFIEKNGHQPKGIVDSALASA
ncbi:hypothetical protein WR25_23823 [Diploscapter pachys]|uniref:Solute carrier family 40 member n=1 Tax=Diploscapter pachys TaxID=2018661 RepID=A0A2A2J8J5_9BILA|nr:hypothetical protein WR25_23823 [Diploscapter pachys]